MVKCWKHTKKLKNKHNLEGRLKHYEFTIYEINTWKGRWT